MPELRKECEVKNAENSTIKFEEKRNNIFRAFRVLRGQLFSSHIHESFGLIEPFRFKRRSVLRTSWFIRHSELRSSCESTKTRNFDKERFEEMVIKIEIPSNKKFAEGIK